MVEEHWTVISENLMFDCAFFIPPLWKLNCVFPVFSDLVHNLSYFFINNYMCCILKNFLVKIFVDCLLLIFFWLQQAILTFEDDQLDRALENLKKAQRICCVENIRKGTGMGLDEQLMRQILYADCELYMALLTFLKQGKTDTLSHCFL